MMTNLDFIEIIGYLTLSFTFGYVAGFLQKVFFKAVGLIK